MTNSHPSPGPGYRWAVFAVLAFAYILVYFHRLCAAVVGADMMADLNASGTELGVLASLYFYPYALMQLPAGLLSDSWGPRRTITVFFVAAVAGSMMLGMAPSLPWALIGRAVVGVGVAMLFVPTMKVLAEWFTAAEFAGMTGIMIAMGGVGSMTATTPLAWLSDAVGWRGSFKIVGAATLALAGLVWLVVRDRPSDLGLPSPVAERGPGEAPIKLAQGMRMVLARPGFWPLAGWFFFGCGIFFAFIGLWGGPFFMDIYGMSKPEAGNVLLMSAIGMVVGSPLLGWLSNRVFQARKPLLASSGVMGVVLTGALAFFPDALPAWSLYLICFLMGVFINAMVTIGFTATKELFPVAIAGTSTGLVNLFPFLGGAILQAVMGRLLDLAATEGGAFTIAGYRSAHLAMFVCAVLAALSSFLVPETLARHSKLN